MADRRRLFELIVLAGIGISAAIAAGVAVEKHDRSTIIAAGFDRLRLFHGLRQAALEDHLNSMASDVRAAGRNLRVRRALQDFSAAWAALGPDASNTMRALYITKNPYAAGDRQKLSRARDNSRYSERHAAFHQWARRFIAHFRYFDMFLIDRDGTVLYSVMKEDDFGTNLREGKYDESSLAFVYQIAVKRKGKQIAFSDFERYGPSNDTAAAFAANAIVADDGSVLGVFAVQLPPDPINDLLGFASGLGRTGETYLVGADQLMRSQSRLSNEATFLVKKVATASVNQGIAGFSGADTIRSPDGRRILSVYAPVDFRGQRWVLLAEIERAEVMEAATPWRLLLAALAAGLAAAGAGFLLLRLLSVLRR